MHHGVLVEKGFESDLVQRYEKCQAEMEEKKEKETYEKRRFITGELLGQKIRHGPAVAYCWYAHTWCRLVTARLLQSKTHLKTRMNNENKRQLTSNRIWEMIRRILFSPLNAQEIFHKYTVQQRNVHATLNLIEYLQDFIPLG